MTASSRGRRRFHACFIAILAFFVVSTFAVDVHWLTRLSSVVVLAGQVPLGVVQFAYAEIAAEGVFLDVHVRRRMIPWSEIEEFELGDPYGHAPRIGLTDGSTVKNSALGGFVLAPDGDDSVASSTGGRNTSLIQSSAPGASALDRCSNACLGAGAVDNHLRARPSYQAS